MLVKTLLTTGNYLDFDVLIVRFCGWTFFEFLIFSSVRQLEKAGRWLRPDICAAQSR